MGRILRHRIHSEGDVVAARRRAKQIAELIDLSKQDQSRLATGVSEIARNAFDYAGGGDLEFAVERDGHLQHLMVTVVDEGPGIPHLDQVLAGTWVSPTGMGIGITGTRAMMDRFDIDTVVGEGTTVRFGKRFPVGTSFLDASDFRRIANELAKRRVEDPIAEMQDQNQELLQAMGDLRRREEESARLYREAEAAARARDALLAIVSHDLRNPLNAVLMSATFMVDHGDTVSQTTLFEQLRIIQRSTRQANRLIEDLLDVTRIEEGGLSIEAAPLPAAEVIESTCELMRSTAEKAGVSLCRGSVTPAEVLADHDRVLQLLSNLVSNAIKFTPTGGTVELRCEKRSGVVRFEVADTGEGMTKEQMENVFNRFWQANRSDRRGVGLGLSIVRGIVEAHSGSIEIESNLGEGTTIRVDLPAA